MENSKNTDRDRGNKTGIIVPMRIDDHNNFDIDSKEEGRSRTPTINKPPPFDQAQFHTIADQTDILHEKTHDSPKQPPPQKPPQQNSSVMNLKNGSKTNKIGVIE